MAAKWVKSSFPGVRYRLHPSRRHGVKKDRYFTLRYKISVLENGISRKKDIEEGVGWSSDGWTEASAYELLTELRRNQKAGQGPQTLKESREAERRRREAEHAAWEEAARQAVTFAEIFRDRYFPYTKTAKSKRAWETEQSLYRRWIDPAIGGKSMKDIAPFHLQRIRKNMEDAGRSARSVNYAFSVVRQVYNFARHNRIYFGDWPGSNGAVRMVRQDNRRMRYLTRQEADELLAALRQKSVAVHDVTLLSLHCGLRAGEIFNLSWNDIDLQRGTIFIRDPKSGRNRHTFMTNAVRQMLIDRAGGEGAVFPARGGERMDRVSKTFNRTVDELGLNRGVSDRRQRVVFHSCRHTYASWLVENGVSLYAVKELLGHERIDMTERYSHLSKDHLRDAVKVLEAGTTATTADVIELRK